MQSLLNDTVRTSNAISPSQTAAGVVNVSPFESFEGSRVAFPDADSDADDRSIGPPPSLPDGDIGKSTEYMQGGERWSRSGQVKAVRRRAAVAGPTDRVSGALQAVDEATTVPGSIEELR